MILRPISVGVQREREPDPATEAERREIFRLQTQEPHPSLLLNPTTLPKFDLAGTDPNYLRLRLRGVENVDQYRFPLATPFDHNPGGIKEVLQATPPLEDTITWDKGFDIPEIPGMAPIEVVAYLTHLSLFKECLLFQRPVDMTFEEFGESSFWDVISARGGEPDAIDEETWYHVPDVSVSETNPNSYIFSHPSSSSRASVPPTVSAPSSQTGGSHSEIGSSIWDNAPISHIQRPTAPAAARHRTPSPGLPPINPSRQDAGHKEAGHVFQQAAARISMDSVPSYFSDPPSSLVGLENSDFSDPPMESGSKRSHFSDPPPSSYMGAEDLSPRSQLSNAPSSFDVIDAASSNASSERSKEGDGCSEDPHRTRSRSPLSRRFSSVSRLTPLTPHPADRGFRMESQPSKLWAEAASASMSRSSPSLIDSPTASSLVPRPIRTPTNVPGPMQESRSSPSLIDSPRASSLVPRPIRTPTNVPGVLEPNTPLTSSPVSTPTSPRSESGGISDDWVVL